MLGCFCAKSRTDSVADVCIVLACGPVCAYIAVRWRAGDYEYFARQRLFSRRELGVSCYWINIWRCFVLTNSNKIHCSVCCCSSSVIHSSNISSSLSSNTLQARVGLNCATKSRRSFCVAKCLICNMCCVVFQ